MFYQCQIEIPILYIKQLLEFLSYTFTGLLADEIATTIYTTLINFSSSIPTQTIISHALDNKTKFLFSYISKTKKK